MKPSLNFLKAAVKIFFILLMALSLNHCSKCSSSKSDSDAIDNSQEMDGDNDDNAIIESPSSPSEGDEYQAPPANEAPDTSMEAEPEANDPFNNDGYNENAPETQEQIDPPSDGGFNEEDNYVPEEPPSDYSEE